MTEYLFFFKRILLIAIISLQTYPLPSQEKVRIAVVGDIMFHNTQLYRAYNSKTDSYDFTPSFEQIKPVISSADIAIGNLETTLSGYDGALSRNDKQYYRGYQGYPWFNTPDEIAKNLKDSGFDIITTSNNHSMDGGSAGLTRTYRQLTKAGLAVTGTGEVNVLPLSFEKDGMRFVLISYTYGTNGINPKGSDKSRINTLDYYKDESVTSLLNEVKVLKDSGIYDFVLVSIHFGSEYRNLPTERQKSLVNELFSYGADIVLGSHPHVPQPVEVLQLRDIDGTKKNGAVIYSLGNFIASQPHNEKMPYWCDGSLILQLDFSRDADGSAVLKEISCVPIWVQWKKEYIRVIPVDAALEDPENSYNLTSKDKKRVMKWQEYLPGHISSLIKTVPVKENGAYVIWKSKDTSN